MTATLITLIAWKERERDEQAREGGGRPTPSGWRVVVQRENEANLATVRRLGFVLSGEEVEAGSGHHLLTLERPWGWKDSAVSAPTAPG